MHTPEKTAEQRAAEDAALYAHLQPPPRAKVPIAKLLKRPLKWFGKWSGDVTLVGVNLIGMPLLEVTRRGTQLSARGQGWAMSQLFAALPPAPAPDPLPPPSDVPTA